MTTSRRSPAPADRKRDPERTKARIVAAAVEEFGARGYAATRTSDIAARAGVNKQLISYYFGGKEGLYREISHQWYRTGTEMSGPALSLDAMVAGFVAATPEQRNLGRLLAWTNLEGDTPDVGEPGFFQAQMAMLRQRQEAGELPADLDPAFLLLALMAAASAPLTLPQVAKHATGEDPAAPEFAAWYAAQLAKMVRYLGDCTDAR